MAKQPWVGTYINIIKWDIRFFSQKALLEALLPEDIL